MASERVVRETAWICLALINENPIKTTNMARDAIGIY